MAGNNKGGGSGWIVILLLLLLLAVLYQCVGVPTYHLPSVLPAGGGAPSSPAAASDESSSAPLSSTDLSADASSAPSSETAISFDNGGVTYAACDSPTTYTSASGKSFSYCAPTDLIAGSYTGTGKAYQTNSAPNALSIADDWTIDSVTAADPSHKRICFPLEGLAYPNSQTYNPGGHDYLTAYALGLPPSQRTSMIADADTPVDKTKVSGPAYTAALNAKFKEYNDLHGLMCKAGTAKAPWNVDPWRDTYCEGRNDAKHANAICTSGKGHQGQDIRPQTCDASTYWVVAAENGVVEQVASYYVKVRSTEKPYRFYTYLHMEKGFDAHFKIGQPITRGERLGRASNNFGTSTTSIHLHFEMRLNLQSNVVVDGKPLALNAYVPPYVALINAYKRRLDGTDAGCASTPQPPVQ